MRAPRLKPCPFCGGKASMVCIEQPDGTPTWEVDCENKGCEVSACTSLHPSKQDAADVWNTRWNEKEE